MRTVFGFALVLFASTPVSRGGVLELPPIGRAERSTTYDVTAGGKAMNPQRCDGRGGPASYVHLLISEPTVFTVRSPQAKGQWQINGVHPVKAETTADSATFTLDGPDKLVISTAADERLFIFVDAPPADVPQPGAPGVISIADRDVDDTGGELVTDKIQKAIDELAARKGGGTLVFPPGSYRTGTIRIKSNVTVHLSAGARLAGSETPADYPLDPGTTEQLDRPQDIRSRLVLFDQAENAALVGLGEIDGAAQVIRGKHQRVPNLIRVRRSKNVRIEGVLLRRAAGWNTHIVHSENVTLRNVKVMSNWSDGVDVDNSSSVKIEDALIDSYDDSFAIKSTGFEEQAYAVRDIRLRDAVLCTVKSAAKIGTETLAKIMENITLENVAVAQSRGALVILLRDGALIRNIRYDRIRIDNSRQAVDWNISRRGGLGRIEGVVAANVSVADAIPSVLAGYDADHSIRNVRFINFRRAGQLAVTPEQAGLKANEYVEDMEFASSEGASPRDGGY